MGSDIVSSCRGKTVNEVVNSGLLPGLLAAFDGKVNPMCRVMGWKRSGSLRRKLNAALQDVPSPTEDHSPVVLKVSSKTVPVHVAHAVKALGLSPEDLELLSREHCLDRGPDCDDILPAYSKLETLSRLMQCSMQDALYAAKVGRTLHTTEQERVYQQIGKLEEALEHASKRREAAENFVDNIVFQLSRTLGCLEPTPFDYSWDHKEPIEEEYAVTLWSDWQGGSAWRKQDTQGFSDMNSAAIGERIELLTKKTIGLVELQRKARKIEDLVINMLGDMVEGDVIFDNQGVFTDQHGLAQMASCLHNAENSILTLLSHFREIRAYCVWGNHGRMGPKKNSQHPQNNWDYLFYLWLAERFKHEPRFKMFISTGPWMAYNLPKAPNWNHLNMHGDGIPQSLGIPWYGINRETSKLIDILDTPIHYVHLGHFHQAAQLDKAYGAKIINGCLTGPSPHALKHALAGLPKQLLYGLHPSVGQTWQYFVHLAEYPDMSPDENGIMTTYTTGLTS